MKKLLSLALCLVMLMSMMSGLMVTAAAEDDGVVDAELTAHLRVLYPGTSDLEKEIAGDIAAEMKKKYPNVEVEFLFLVWSDLESKLAAMIASGDYPDVMQIQDVVNPVSMGALEPVQSWIENSKTLKMDDFSQVALDNNSVDGTLYAVPLCMIPYSHIVNTELFANAGIDYKAMTSWDDVLNAVKAISTDDVNGFAMANGGEGRFTFRDFMMIALSNGFTPDDTSEETKAKYIEALTFIENLAPCMPKSQSTWLYPELFKAWEAGTVGMMHTGTYFTGNVVSHGVTSMDRTAVCPMPAGPSAEQPTLMVGTNGYAMIAGSTQKEAAWAFIETAMSEPILGKLAGSMNVSAVNYLSDETLIKYASVAYDQYGEGVGEKHIALMNQFKEAADQYGIPMPKILGQASMEKVVQGAIIKLTNGEVNAEQAYEEIKEGIDEVKASLE